jgi:hypothetical protein
MIDKTIELYARDIMAERRISANTTPHTLNLLVALLSVRNNIRVFVSDMKSGTIAKRIQFSAKNAGIALTGIAPKGDLLVISQ